MSVINKIINCYHKEFDKAEIRFAVSRCTSDASTTAPSVDLNCSSDFLEAHTDQSEHEYPVDDILENMRRLATKRRYDGAHVRFGDKLVLNR